METKSKEKIVYRTGVYSGMWGGYHVKLDDTGLKFDVVDGIRSMGEPCIVDIKRGDYAKVVIVEIKKG